MTTNSFHQFMSPTLLGLPLMALALSLPWLLYPTPSPHWLGNRLLTLQNWFFNRFSLHLLSPMGPNSHKWAPLLTTLMTLLITLNLLGLLPYTFTPTTHLALSLGLAAPLWFATVLTGLQMQPTQTLGHLLPLGTPTPLIPALIIIETLSLFIRPLALGIRLTANLTAGHLLLQLVATTTLTLLSVTPPAALLTTSLLLLLTLLETAVAGIQAYVFILLLSLYLQENTAETPR